MTSFTTGPFDLTETFVRLRSGDAMDVEALTPSFWSDRSTSPETRNVFNFEVVEREGVDALHRKLTDLGYASTQEPVDAFWGSRYAICADPDGNHVGIMSAADPALRRGPPDL